ncbi:MAG: hypothetical protein JJV94_02710 [Sulfurospirillum sp.]|nr:hypothetical protein [Sulfurospirillum sp.]
MIFNNIVNEFQNYSYNDTSNISSYLNNLKSIDSLDENNLNIQEYLLPEVMTLLNKAVLNRFSTDLLFKENYWSWGIVTLYYSNFFLSQALNRLKGDFFTFIPSYGRGQGRRNIKLDTDGKYKLLSISNAYKDSHGGELKKIKENYSFLLLDSTQNNNFLRAISNINESQIRNKVNYQLTHFKELSLKKFYNNISLEECKFEYNNYCTHSTAHEEFKFLGINTDRFNLIFYMLNKIKNINSDFENKFINFEEILRDETRYKFSNDTMKIIENKLNANMNFHSISSILEKQIKGLLS